MKPGNHTRVNYSFQRINTLLFTENPPDIDRSLILSVSLYYVVDFIPKITWSICSRGGMVRKPRKHPISDPSHCGFISVPWAEPGSTFNHISAQKRILFSPKVFVSIQSFLSFSSSSSFSKDSNAQEGNTTLPPVLLNLFWEKCSALLSLLFKRKIA